MVTLDSLTALVQAHGLLLLAPISVVEGPIVTVVAAYLARLGFMNIFAVYAVCVMGDLIGDGILYGIGRAGPGLLPARWRLRIGATEERMIAVEEHFRQKGGRTLVIGKLTHSAGVAVLIAAGASRMPFLGFLWWNLIATLPKTAFFATLGYTLGYAYGAIDSWIFRASVGLLALIVLAGLGWVWHHRRRAP